MPYFPLLFKNDLSCLIVGGGQVATRKIEALAEMASPITIVAPQITPFIESGTRKGSMRWLKREYLEGDCRGFQLVIAATPDKGTNRKVSEEAKQLGIPINVVDDPELSTVIFPAVWRDGSLLVAVSTEGTAPFMAAEIRTRLAGGIRRMGRWVDIAGRFREIVRREIQNPEEKLRLYRRFIEAGEPEESANPPDKDDLNDWIAWLDTRRAHRS
jgi:uroporphyrin-III C-methyltransferase/precorrin-2 dehydrogenase/sirohydrochlorin ferrochelatase